MDLQWAPKLNQSCEITIAKALATEPLEVHRHHEIWQYDQLFFQITHGYSSYTRFDGILYDQLCGEPPISSETKPISISATLIFDVEVPSSCFGRLHMFSSSTQDVS